MNNLKTLIEIIIDFLISIVTISLGVCSLITIMAFENSGKHWNNGPLPGYETANEFFHTMYNFTTTCCIISLSILGIVLLIQLIRIVIQIVKNGFKSALSTIVCTIILFGNSIILIGILSFTHIFTYGMSI